MDIALYISELLRDHNEISLSGIGTFCKKRISAKYDRATGILYPPSEEISFKTGDSNNSELVRYVSAVKNISDAGARYFINKFVDHIRQSLASEGQADLSPLGILHNQNGHLSMSPLSTEASSFGLSPVQDTAFSPPARKMADSQTIPVSPPAEFAEEEKPARSNSLGQAILVILILIIGTGGLAYVFYPELFDLKTDRPLQVNEQPAKVTAPPVQQDTLQNHPQTSALPATTGVTKRTDSVPRPKPAVTTTAPVAPTEKLPKFEVIGASFGLRSEAEDYIKVMKNRGIRASIYEDTRKPRFKISLGSYTTYEEANLEKRKVQNTFNREAWILTVKDKVKQ